MVLFTTDCPRCKVIERKLDAKGIEYEKQYDVSEVVNKGFSSAPILKTDDGKYLDFASANAYINSLRS